MTESALRFDPDGLCRLTGPITLETVPALWGAFSKGTEKVSPLTLDLSGVTHTDSAALALLLEVAAWAERNRIEVRFRDLPDSLLALARLSNADELLTG